MKKSEPLQFPDDGKVGSSTHKTPEGRPSRDRLQSQDLRQENALLERLSRQVQVSTTVAQDIAAAQDLDDLFQRVVRLVKERFGYYYTQLLRFDPAANRLVLAAGYGQVGVRMLADGHALPVGVGLIGVAAQTRTPVLRPSVADDPDWKPNPLLPRTRGEVAVPILWQDEVLGVLDVQSHTAGSLGQEDCLLLEGLCGQVAIAIQNTRLVSELRTSQARTEQALEDLSRERALLRTLIDTLPDQVFAKDRRSRFTMNNLAHLKLLGCETQADALGKTDADMFPSADAEIYFQDEQKLMETGVALIDHEEEVVNNQTGERGWNAVSKVPLRDEHGQVIGMVGIARDVTFRKNAEARVEALVKERTQQLAISEERYRLMAQQAGQMVYDLVIPEERIVWAGAIEKLTGFSEADFAGLDMARWSELIHPDDRAAALGVIQHAVQTASSYETQYRFQRKDGAYFDAEDRGGFLFDEQGRPIRMLGVVSDVTERKQAAEATRRLYERRGRQVQLSTQVAQEFFTASDLPALFERVVVLIKECFGYYHTRFFRFEPALNSLVLVAGYEETDDPGAAQRSGANLLASDDSASGMAAAEGKTILRPDLAAMAGWQPKSIGLGAPDPWLPAARGEIAVPVRLRERLLGVLDVFSDRPGALDEDDRLLLEGLCGQIAIAVEDIRLRQEMQERLQELDHLYRATSREGWESYRRRYPGPLEYYYDQLAVQPAGGMWQAETRKAMECNEIILPPGDRQQPGGAPAGTPAAGAELPAPAIAVPLALRGEVIGALAVQDDPQQRLSTEDMDMVLAIAEQVVLALESARLFEQTQDALAETETLYSIIAELNAADSYADILNALAARTLLGEAGPLLMLAIFDRPLSATQRPEWIYPVACRTQAGIQVAARYPLSAFEPTPSTLFTDHLVVLDNLSADHRVDRVTRTLFQEVFQAQSSLVVPLLLGSQVIGFIQGYFSHGDHGGQPAAFSAEEQSRLMAVASQAAIAVQSRLLLEQAQARARQEQRIREVTAQVFAASDVDSIMRRAVEQVGQALGVPAYIYLGQGGGNE